MSKQYNKAEKKARRVRRNKRWTLAAKAKKAAPVSAPKVAAPAAPVAAAPVAAVPEPTVPAPEPAL